MPYFKFAPDQFLISHRSVLIDTNVLVAAFDLDEVANGDARWFLDDRDDIDLLIPVAVVIEAWGFLVGSRNKWDSGYELLAWLNTPGRALLVAQDGILDIELQLVTSIKKRIDCVDAIVSRLATTISSACALSRPVPIATFDTADYFLISERHQLNLKVLDMREATQYLDDL